MLFPRSKKRYYARLYRYNDKAYQHVNFDDLKAFFDWLIKEMSISQNRVTWCYIYLKGDKRDPVQKKKEDILFLNRTLKEGKLPLWVVNSFLYQ